MRVSLILLDHSCSIIKHLKTIFGQIIYILFQDIQDESERPFYESDKDDDGSDASTEAKPKPKPFVMDSDHRLLLRQAKPLLNSRNGSVCITSI